MGQCDHLTSASRSQHPRNPETKALFDAPIHWAIEFDLLMKFCRIKRNATVSPLLPLLFEIREKIYRYMLGDRFIRLKYLNIGANDVYPHDNSKINLSDLGHSWSQLVSPSDGLQDDGGVELTGCWQYSNWSWNGSNPHA